MVPTTVANVTLSPSFGAGSCVEAADVLLTVAIAMLGGDVVLPLPPLPARAGATASVRPAASASMNGIWRFMRHLLSAGRTAAGRAVDRTGRRSTEAAENPHPPIG